MPARVRTFASSGTVHAAQEASHSPVIFVRSGSALNQL
jgi:hypothetical protein